MALYYYIIFQEESPVKLSASIYGFEHNLYSEHKLRYSYQIEMYPTQPISIFFTLLQCYRFDARIGNEKLNQITTDGQVTD